MPNPTSGDQSPKTTLRNLLSLYEDLLHEYEQIASFSDKILKEVEGETDQKKVLLLLKEKFKIAESIAEKTHRISQTPVEKPPSSDFELLSQTKKILNQIKGKAEELLESENKIDKILKSKGMKIK